MATFIGATTEIIEESGIDSVSIRTVASRAGYSSATMYLYFDDISQLVTLASISHLRAYATEISEHINDFNDLKERYLYTWRVFCQHSLKNPAIFIQLFFNRHAESLDSIVKKYYSIFPNELEHISSSALSMLMAGSLFDRNMNILKPYALQEGFSDEKANIINEMTVCYFRNFLERSSQVGTSDEEKEIAIDRFIKGISFLL